jgi:hypothetical protein
MDVNTEYGRTQKEAFVAYFMALSQNLHRRTDENHKELQIG